MSDVRLASAEGHERGRVCLAPLAAIGGHVAATYTAVRYEPLRECERREMAREWEVWGVWVRTGPYGT